MKPNCLAKQTVECIGDNRKTAPVALIELLHSSGVVMSAKPKLEPSRKIFIGELGAASALVAAVQSVPGSSKPMTTPTLHPKNKIQVVELAFMGIVAAWEEFLEATLVRYVAGASTAAGYSPTPKFGLATDITHSYQFLSGKSNFNPNSDYLRASDHAWVRNKANFVFSSHTYGCLAPSATVLDAANKIRNRVAHSSAKCKSDFKVIALQLLGLPATGTLKQGYSAGNLLLAATTASFSVPHPAGSNHFSAFVYVFNNLARTIVP